MLVVPAASRFCIPPSSEQGNVSLPTSVRLFALLSIVQLWNRSRLLKLLSVTASTSIIRDMVCAAFLPPTVIYVQRRYDAINTSSLVSLLCTLPIPSPSQIWMTMKVYQLLWLKADISTWLRSSKNPMHLQIEVQSATKTAMILRLVPTGTVQKFRRMEWCWKI